MATLLQSREREALKARSLRARDSRRMFVSRFVNFTTKDQCSQVGQTWDSSNTSVLDAGYSTGGLGLLCCSDIMFEDYLGYESIMQVLLLYSKAPYSTLLAMLRIQTGILLTSHVDNPAAPAAKMFCVEARTISDR